MIRPALPADAAALAALAERTFRDAFAADNTAEDMALHCQGSYGEAIQAREIDDPRLHTLLAIEGGALVGYAQLRWHDAPPCVQGLDPGEIQRIYVDRAWHGKGIAQALMAEGLAVLAARGSRVAWLGVWERNPRAIAFYAKSGFVACGEHLFVVGNDPQRDVVMARPLP